MREMLRRNKVNNTEYRSGTNNVILQKIRDKIVKRFKQQRMES